MDLKKELARIATSNYYRNCSLDVSLIIIEDIFWFIDKRKHNVISYEGIPNLLSKAVYNSLRIPHLHDPSKFKTIMDY